MSVSEEDVEKKGVTAVAPASDGTTPAYDDAVADERGVGEVNPLKRSLQGRHMQMIAIGMLCSYVSLSLLVLCNMANVALQQVVLSVPVYSLVQEVHCRREALDL